MARPCNKPLKTNPFTTQRDPKTGRWEVIKSHPRKPKAFLGKLRHHSLKLPQITLQKVDEMGLQA